MVRRQIMAAVQQDLFQGKVIMLTGPRQVGKTTMLRELANQTQRSVLWLNCDEPDDRADLENVTSSQLRALIGTNELVFIDEAQRVPNIGLNATLVYSNRHLL